MDVVITAAGKGSRFKHNEYQGHKALFEFNGTPLVGHMINAISAATPVSHITIVGAKGSSDGGEIYQYLREHGRPLGIPVTLVEGDRRGFGYSLWLASREILENHFADKTLLMPCDTILSDYRGLAEAEDVTLALHKLVEASSKYRIVARNEDGSIDYSHEGRERNPWAFLGIFTLNQRALEKFESLFHEVIKRSNTTRDAINENGELRVSWIWPELEENGFRIGSTAVPEFAELNFPSQIENTRELISRCSAHNWREESN